MHAPHTRTHIHTSACMPPSQPNCQLACMQAYITRLARKLLRNAIRLAVNTIGTETVEMKNRRHEKKNVHHSHGTALGINRMLHRIDLKHHVFVGRFFPEYFFLWKRKTTGFFYRRNSLDSSVEKDAAGIFYEGRPSWGLFKRRAPLEAFWRGRLLWIFYGRSMEEGIIRISCIRK